MLYGRSSEPTQLVYLKLYNHQTLLFYSLFSKCKPLCMSMMYSPNYIICCIHHSLFMTMPARMTGSQSVHNKQGQCNKTVSQGIQSSSPSLQDPKFKRYLISIITRAASQVWRSAPKHNAALVSFMAHDIILLMGALHGRNVK